MVLLYASKYNDICTVVNISGRFHLERGIEGRLGQGYLQRIKQHGFIDVKNRKGKLQLVNIAQICPYGLYYCRLLRQAWFFLNILYFQYTGNFSIDIFKKKLHLNIDNQGNACFFETTRTLCHPAILGTTITNLL